MKLVADASALVEYLLGTARSQLIRQSIAAADVELYVPALCDIEVASALRRLLNAKELTFDRSLEALQDYLDMPLQRHGHESLLPRMLELRDNFSAYDAAYVVLAERLGSKLLSADEPLIRAIRKHLPRVAM